MRPLRSSYLFLILFCCIWHAVSAQDSPFTNLLHVVKHRDKVVFEGIKITTYLSEHAYVSNAVHILKDKNSEKFEYLPWGNHVYQEGIFDKNHVYHVNPSKQLAFRLPYSYHGPNEKTLLNLASKNYVWKIEGEEVIAGYSANTITATPKNGTLPLMKYWIDDKNRVILMEERFNDKGELAYSAYFTYIRFLKTLPQQLFQLEPKVRIRDFPVPKELEGKMALQNLEFTPFRPHFIPEGFSLVGTYLTQWPNQEKLHFLYSDGLRSFSIYENKHHGPYRHLKGATLEKVDNREVEYLAHSEGKIVRFSEGVLTIAVVGNLPKGWIERIALDVPALETQSPQGNTLSSDIFRYFKRGLHRLRRIFGFIEL